MHLVGVSAGGPLAFELALQIKGSTNLTCGSICLVDPVPYCRYCDHRSNVAWRAQLYDSMLPAIIGQPTRLSQAVTLRDIKCINDLESLLNLAAGNLARELSLIADVARILSDELLTRDLSPHREKYAGLCVFFKADPDFFIREGFDPRHPDGVYGWSLPLGSPGLKPIPLDCHHMEIVSDEDSVRRVASELVRLLQIAEGSRYPETMASQEVNTRAVDQDACSSRAD